MDGALSVADSAVVAWTGTMAVRHGVSVSGGTLYADGETTLDVTPDAERVDSGSDETEYGFVVANGGAFDVGKTTVTGDMQVEAGATLVFSSRSRGDSDTLEVNGKFDFSGYDSVHEATTSIVYDFGDAVPYGGAELVFVPQRKIEIRTDSEGNKHEEPIEDYAYDVSASGVENIVVMNEAWPTLLTVKRDGSLAEEEIVFTLREETVEETLSSTTETNPDTGERTTVETVLKKVVFSLETEQEISNLSLHYDGFSARQNAVSHALLRANQLGSADISPFAAEYNRLQNASELAAALDSIGVPVNLIAIDELHDKQASAVTGALSRRSRELRSGFIHVDTWSNPLFGNSGFTYAARPDSGASSGFVPYLSPFEDNPLMIWMNGGFSFSEADDNEGMALSKTKSNMLNVFMGADYALSDDVAVGIFAGFTSGRTKFDDGGRTEIQSRNIGVYLAGCETDEIGSLYYTALAAFGFDMIDWGLVGVRVILMVFLTPAICIVTGFLLSKLFRVICARMDRSVKKAFRVMQVINVMLLSTSISINNVQKAMGSYLLALVVCSGADASPDSFDFWTVAVLSAAIMLGLLLGGYKLIYTVGKRIYRVGTLQSYVAQLSTAVVAFTCTFTGIPVSTGQVVSSSIIGVGIADRVSAVHWNAAGKIFTSWILTFPVAACMGAVVCLLLGAMVL